MDLKDFDTQSAAEAGVELAIRHPTSGAELGPRVMLRGADAPSYRAALLDQRRRRLELLARGGQERVDPEQLDRETVELLVTATIGWSGFTLDGAAFDYTPANARTLYEKWPWIREQAAEFISARANFLPRSASA